MHAFVIDSTPCCDPVSFVELVGAMQSPSHLCCCTLRCLNRCMLHRAPSAHPHSRVRRVRSRVSVKVSTRRTPALTLAGASATGCHWSRASASLRTEAMQATTKVTKRVTNRCHSYEVGRWTATHESSDASTATMCTGSTVPPPARPSPPVRRPRSQASARSGCQSSPRSAAICMAERRGAFPTPKEHAAPLGVADWRDSRLRADCAFGAVKERCV